MTRSMRSVLFGSLAMAAGVVGCAHCDTCDDLPVPCVGPNCGTGTVGFGNPSLGPAAVGPFEVPPASGGSTPAILPPALPNTPLDSPPQVPAADAPK